MSVQLSLEVHYLYAGRALRLPRENSHRLAQLTKNNASPRLPHRSRVNARGEILRRALRLLYRLGCNEVPIAALIVYTNT